MITSAASERMRAASICCFVLAACHESAPRTSDTAALPEPLIHANPSTPAAQPAADTIPILTLERGFGFAQAESLFNAASSARAVDLDGLWFQITHILAHGRAGQPEMIWREDSTATTTSGDDRRRAWTLRFSHDSTGRVQLITNLGNRPDRSSPGFTSDGDLLFGPDFDADNSPTYNCRAVSSVHLVCLDKAHGGEAFEFRKVAK